MVIASLQLLPGELGFQYSLCRVVLMVLYIPHLLSEIRQFQYSLCRVVLMVTLSIGDQRDVDLVSVLALSSRFDGPNGFDR